MKRLNGCDFGIFSGVRSFLFWISLPLAVIGCSMSESAGANGQKTCKAGERVTCPCPGGSTGIQICKADQTFGNCRCDVYGDEPGDATGVDPVGRGDSETLDPSGDNSEEDQPESDYTFESLAVGPNHTCALTTENTIRCWGAINLIPIDPVVEYDAPVADISTAESHLCAVTESGTVNCRGDNSAGQLGRESGEQHDGWVSATWTGESTEPVQKLQSGMLFSIGLTEDGGIAAWGENDSRQSRPGFGNLDEPTWRATTLALLDEPFRGISAGVRHACGIREAGSLQCWGNNRSGQLGFGPCEPDKQPCSANKIANIEGTFKSVSAGAHHTCGLKSSGDVTCWGDGEAGQLGGRGTTKQTIQPVDVPVQQTLRSLGKAMGDTQCGISQDDDVICWGNNRAGQALPSSSDEQPLAGPAQIELNGASAVDVGSGVQHSCALFDSVRVRCWGSNQKGQVGPFDTGVN